LTKRYKCFGQVEKIMLLRSDIALAYGETARIVVVAIVPNRIAGAIAIMEADRHHELFRNKKDGLGAGIHAAPFGRTNTTCG
jgi:hypothetical protein